jgi:hypothetical protein
MGTAAAAIGIGVLGVGAPAQAASTVAMRLQMTCSSAGFTGWMRLYGTQGRDLWGNKYTIGTATKIQYKIKPKGGSRVHNDVFLDYATPSEQSTGGLFKVVRSGDHALSDNKWHTIREKDFGVGRVDGIWQMSFIFDLKDKKDPRCSKSKQN